MTTEGEGTQGSAEGAQSGAGENTSGADSNTGTGTSGSNDSSGVGLTAVEIAEIRERADSYQNRMKAADQRAAKFEAELKQLRDKDLPEQEKLVRDYAAAQEAVQTLTTRNQELALKVAFLSDNTVTWHNPERALKLADLSQVTIDDDGKVTGLKDALVALAKSDDYLVKKESSDSQEDTGGAQRPPATAPGTNGGSGTTRPTKSALTTRLPALNTRVTRQ